MPWRWSVPPACSGEEGSYCDHVRRAQRHAGEGQQPEVARVALEARGTPGQSPDHGCAEREQVVGIAPVSRVLAGVPSLVRCESGANQIIARAVATIPSNAIISQPGQWLPSRKSPRPGQVHRRRRSEDRQQQWRKYHQSGHGHERHGLTGRPLTAEARRERPLERRLVGGPVPTPGTEERKPL